MSCKLCIQIMAIDS